MCSSRRFNDVKMLPAYCLLVELLLNNKHKDDLILKITLCKFRTKTKRQIIKILIKSGYFWDKIVGDINFHLCAFGSQTFDIVFKIRKQFINKRLPTSIVYYFIQAKLMFVLNTSRKLILFKLKQGNIYSSLVYHRNLMSQVERLTAWPILLLCLGKKRLSPSGNWQWVYLGFLWLGVWGGEEGSKRVRSWKRDASRCFRFR